MTRKEIVQVFVDVLLPAAGSQREINDGGTETGKAFLLEAGDIAGVAENLATWWEEASEEDPTPETAEDFLDEIYPAL